MNQQKEVFIAAETVTPSLAPLQSFGPGKQNPDPLKTATKISGVPASILIDKDVMQGDNEAEVHRHEADLWICIEGEIRFRIGGTLVDGCAKKNADGTFNDKELKAKTIRGGTEYTLRANDILYIPEGLPHMHWTGNGSARLWIIKIPAKSLFPLEEVQGLARSS
jgi:mannose-6-phosphate isomerase-like protein (cupin superfamily)